MEKVWLRGVPGRGEEVTDRLKEFGGKITGIASGCSDDPKYILSIDHDGDMIAMPEYLELAKVIMDCYKPISLPDIVDASMGHKIFEPFQKMLRAEFDGCDKVVWTADVYSYFCKESNKHHFVSGYVAKDNEVIPYWGNEEKLGKAVKGSNHGKKHKM